MAVVWLTPEFYYLRIASKSDLLKLCNWSLGVPQGIPKYK